MDRSGFEHYFLEVDQCHKENWVRVVHDQQAKVIFAKALRIYQAHQGQPKFVKVLWNDSLLSCTAENLAVERDICITLDSHSGELVNIPAIIKSISVDHYTVEYDDMFLDDVSPVNDRVSTIVPIEVPKTKVCVRGEIPGGEDRPVALLWKHAAEASDQQELSRLYRDDLQFQSEWNQSRTVTCITVVSGESNLAADQGLEPQGYVMIGFADGTLTMWSLDENKVCATLNHANFALTKHPIIGKWIFNPLGRLPGRWKIKQGSNVAHVNDDLLLSLDPTRRVKLDDRWYTIQNYDRQSREVELDRPAKRDAENLEATQLPLPNESIVFAHMSEDARFAVTISESTVRAWKLPRSSAIR